MIEAAKKVPGTERITTKLQTEQNQLWLSERRSPADVFKALNFGTQRSPAVLVDPRLNAWTSYLQAFNSANPGKETTLLATLTAHYTELGLAQLLQEGKRSTLTKKIAEDLQVAQFSHWFYSGKQPKDIFNLLDGQATYQDQRIVKEYNQFYKLMVKGKDE